MQFLVQKRTFQTMALLKTARIWKKMLKFWRYLLSRNTLLYFSQNWNETNQNIVFESIIIRIFTGCLRFTTYVSYENLRWWKSWPDERHSNNVDEGGDVSVHAYRGFSAWARLCLVDNIDMLQIKHMLVLVFGLRFCYPVNVWQENEIC